MRSFLTITLFLVLTGGSALGQEKAKSWTGQIILVKKTGLTITKTDEQGKQIEVAQLEGLSYHVLAEDGDKIKVKTRSDMEGWLAKDDAVLLADAVAYFTGLIEEDNQDLDAYNARAAAWQLKKNPDNAIKDYTEAIRIYPQGDALYNNRSVSYQSKKEYGKAVEDLTEAIRLRPDYAPYYRNRRLLNVQLKEYRKALEDSDQAIRLEPANVDHYFVRGVDARKVKDHDKAIADFTEVLRLAPTNTYAYLLRGMSWSAKKDKAKAKADYDEFKRNVPKDASGCNDLAWLLATSMDDQVRDGKQAVELAKQAVKLEPKNASYMDTLAAAYAEAGNFEEAVRWQQQALQDPDFGEDGEARRRLELFRNKMPYREE